MFCNFETIISNKMPKVETFDKQEVIGKALNLFQEKGYNLTSMQDLVDVTGLNRSSIYNSFGSKLHLYKECLKSYKQETKKVLSGTIESKNCAISRLEAIFRLGVSSDKKFMEKGCLFNSCASEMANQEVTVKNILLDNKDDMLSLFSEIIADGQKNKLINTSQSARAYGLYLLSSFQGLRISGILMNDIKDLEQIVDTTLSVLK